MGKKQHQKDKLYLTCTEWTELYGGKKAAEGGEKRSFKKLPFFCCSLSLQPFEHPVCTPEGAVFDLLNIVPYLKKYGHNPVSGKPMDPKSLIRLHYHKNKDDAYHCPVTFKVFNENSNIVAIRSTGNVFSYEAVERLNIKPRHFCDLLTDEPFSRGDIVTLQDPMAPEKFDVSSFYHVKNKLAVKEDEGSADGSKATRFIRQLNPETRATLDALSKEYKEPTTSSEGKAGDSSTSRGSKSSIASAHYSTGAVSQAFTSTVPQPVTRNEPAILDRETLVYRHVNKKGYVRLHTSLGDMNFELHCDIVPRTCHNFIKHCRDGYYNGTIFHRSIRNFMIQGGDPTATGKGGKSIWGKPFPDEFKPNLVHSGRGVLSMANSGPNTNGSQFFITFRSCRHLDGKHTVFGRLVGGMETLAEMEKITTDAQDKPQEEISLSGCEVFVDPFEEAEAKLAAAEEQAAIATSDDKEQQSGKATQRKESEERRVYRQGVGKYIPKAPSTGIKRSSAESTDNEKPKGKKVKLSSQQKSSYGDFSRW